MRLRFPIRTSKFVMPESGKRYAKEFSLLGVYRSRNIDQTMDKLVTKPLND